MQARLLAERTRILVLLFVRELSLFPQARLLAELTRLSADSRQAAALDVAALVARGGD